MLNNKISLKPLYELNELNECMFPVSKKNGVHLFCSKKVEKGCYCKNHYDVCYVKKQ